ncbi:cadherin-17 isoform X1 [Oreochromis niloticus]|uniref:cadherin-17 isoform X1 n=2 Tax=Oreochromis niloticus TaxID=8128 RepID=UPI0003946390|nr:cadherin-17 isoform X1 [Oreochromis niloticus]
MTHCTEWRNGLRGFKGSSVELAVIMTPMVHLLLLPLLFSIAGGKDLEEKKGPFENTVLDVPEATPVPYPLYQFQVTDPHVNDFRLSGEDVQDISISKDGWLYLEQPLDWSREKQFTIMVEALADEEVVEGPIDVTINVLDVNNKAPYFNQSVYTAVVRENTPAAVPFIRVFATDQDDPETPNARLRYSLVSEIPSIRDTKLFQINPDTGEISTTEQGQLLLKAREGIQYARGEDRSIETLKRKFDDYCSVHEVPYEQNPFFTCVQRAEMRRQNLDPLEDPDYTLFVRVQDLEGASQNALSGNSRVQIAVQQNLWKNPGPIRIKENLEETYPLTIAKVQSNDPDARYVLVQKERELKFPFEITQNGEIMVTEKLDREIKERFILVVLAKDENDNEVDPPMEIYVLVEDVNDNAPVCDEVTVFEFQENEPVGGLVGELLAHDRDKEGTLNSILTYTILSQNPPTASETFSIDDASGTIRTLRLLRRREHAVYNLNVQVSDAVFSTNCKVVVKVIDVNDELPKFEENDYGNETLAEDTPLGHTLLTIKATDNDDPDTGSSEIQFIISEGNTDDVFAVETDGKGVGYLVLAKPLDFETSPSYRLQIDARNPEPLMESLEYGSESTAFFSVSVIDVDEAPKFSMDILDVTIYENITKGSVLLTVQAKDPEGKEIGYKLDGDTHGWLELDAATGEIRTKETLDREKVDSFKVTVTAFEKANPEKSTERDLHVRLLDVNDNVPKLVESQAFICVKNPKPVLIKAEDSDSDPFSQPFTFSFGTKTGKSPNWELHQVDDTTAELKLKKPPSQDKTFSLPITVKDKAGVGVPQAFEVKVCNCTELGYCYIAPEGLALGYGTGPTIGILAGILGFCVIVFVVVIKRINKKSQRKAQAEEEERNAMM